MCSLYRKVQLHTLRNYTFQRTTRMMITQHLCTACCRIMLEKQCALIRPAVHFPSGPIPREKRVRSTLCISAGCLATTRECETSCSGTRQSVVTSVTMSVRWSQEAMEFRRETLPWKHRRLPFFLWENVLRTELAHLPRGSGKIHPLSMIPAATDRRHDRVRDHRRRRAPYDRTRRQCVHP